MKSIIRSTVLLLLAGVMAAGMLTGCSKDEQGDTVTGEVTFDYTTSGDVSVSTGKTLTFIKDGSSEYTLVRPDRADSKGTVVEAATRLRNAIETASGIKLDFTTDWVMPDTDTTDNKEILVGNNDRPETKQVAATLREDDYAIQVVNNKLVILGGSDAKTAEAVDKFIELYFSAAREDLVLECGYRYQFRMTYPLKNLIIGDSSVWDYTVVYAEDCQAEAAYFCDVIRLYTGYSLNMVSSDTAETSKEILIGNTGRSTSVKASDQSYIAAMDGEKLVFAGEGSLTAAAVHEFVKAYVALNADESKVESSLSLTGQLSADTSVKLIDLNVALSGYAETAVVNRYPRLYSFVKTYAPDVLCLQEVSCTTWYDCITKGIDDTPALTDEYGFVGTGRNGTMEGYNAFLTGAYNAILYNKAKYTLEDSGTFWLSETPATPSVGWDGRTRSICTWAKLTDQTSGETFVVMNTQLDPNGKEASVNGAALIAEKAETFQLPVIVTGDFNTTAKAASVTELNNSLMVDAYTIAAESEEVCATINNYGGSVSGNQPTDYIFVSKGLCSVAKHTILKDLIDDQYISSHWAVYAEIQF